MKKIYTFIVLILLASYTFAKTETWMVRHNMSTSMDASGAKYFDDGNDYIVKPVGNGHCLSGGTKPDKTTIYGIRLHQAPTYGQFKMTFKGGIFAGCGYKHSSQDFEVHSLNNPSLWATFQWYSPWAKSSRIRVLDDPHHIVMAVTGPARRTIYIGKWVDPSE
ncbi:hypothetical protein [Candidatus Sororendozoicomonas aggregata]|uniref:hypothetical protein n=1 Tax=Candidatus Sororendozoicomonas aggregata TaxID=3073239 RepID=UPI002ED0F7B7